MTSKIAKQTIEQWQAEGLKPTVDDIIVVNDYGLRVERNAEVADFAKAPRHAYLGDIVLREPCIATQLWIDQTRPLVADDFQSQLSFMAYALACPVEGLVDIRDVKELQNLVKDFAKDTVSKFTPSQVLAAIDWCMNGNQPDNSLLAKEADPREMPSEASSTARELLIHALGIGIDADAVEKLTVPELERTIMVAMMYKGSDMAKSESTKALGDFYTVIGKIHTRLVSEKEKTEG